MNEYGYNGTGNVLAVKQQGDTFIVQMLNLLDRAVIEVEEGFDLTVAFYLADGRLVTKGSLSDGRIIQEEELYYMEITHDESVWMTGDVRIELTLSALDKSVVYHANDVLHVIFEPRRNNKII